MAARSSRDGRHPSVSRRPALAAGEPSSFLLHQARAGINSAYERYCSSQAWRAPKVGETEKHTADALSDAERSRRFQELVLPHLDAAYNLARWLSGSASDADDIVQEAFMRAFRFFDSFHGDRARPWLLAIVRRTWYTEWDRRTSSLEVAELDDEFDDVALEDGSAPYADPQSLVIRAENTRIVHEALAQLPVEFREVLILRELEEMSYREIATVADLPVGTVMSRIARGRKRLAASLQAFRENGAPVTAPEAKRPAAEDVKQAGKKCSPAGKRTPPAAGDAPGPIAKEAPDGLQ
jgi:RNA polymerase sigma-70 factor (ECF subfamily)